MRPIKFTEENIKRVFKSFDDYDGFELEICQADELYPRLYAKFKCCLYSKHSYNRNTIGCGVISKIPSNWYWYFGVDGFGSPYILFDGSYTV